MCTPDQRAANRPARLKSAAFKPTGTSSLFDRQVLKDCPFKPCSMKPWERGSRVITAAGNPESSTSLRSISTRASTFTTPAGQGFPQRRAPSRRPGSGPSRGRLNPEGRFEQRFQRAAIKGRGRALRLCPNGNRRLVGSSRRL